MADESKKHKQLHLARGPLWRRIRKIRKRTRPGAPPGTLTPDPQAAPSQVELFVYTKDRVERRPIVKLSQLSHSLEDKESVIWLNVDGLADIELVREIGELFGIHPLALEDVVNSYQRPKVELYESDLFFVIRTPGGNAERESEQISCFLSGNRLVTFQERPGGDPFTALRAQLEGNRSRIRSRGADYLAYALIDTVIDCYFPHLEQISERLDKVEEAILLRPNAEHISDLQRIKEELLAVKRTFWPLRDAMNSLVRGDIESIAPETRIYFRDCYDHTVQILELVEVYRELCSDLVNVHLSTVSNRMNEVMKVLTVISTIFIPLNFVVGIYGMNFNTEISPWNMPELNSRFGYPSVLGFMFFVAFGMLYAFRRRGWF